MKKIIAILCSFCMLLSGFNIRVSAYEQIEKNVTGHGDISYVIEDNTLTITLAPEEGYVISSLSLSEQDGDVVELEKVDGLTYEANISDESYILDATFRRAIIQLSFDELALRKGATRTIKATTSYVDGDVNTRGDLFDGSLTYYSSNPDVVKIDPKTGKMKALKQGFSRIGATLDSGNDVEDFGYVIVDGTKSEVIGTLTLFSYYSTDRLLDSMAWGHAFTMFENNSGKDITFNTSNMMKVYVPTDTYYEVQNQEDEDGFALISLEHITKGQEVTADLKAQCKAYAQTLFAKNMRGSVESYTVKNGERVYFGNTTEASNAESVEDILFNSDFGETLQRTGKLEKVQEIAQQFVNGGITDYTFLIDLVQLSNEIGYDLSHGFNPFNGHEYEGGVSVNDALNGLAGSHDFQPTDGMSVKITQVQFDAIIDYYQYKNYFNLFERNCSLAATDAWNLATAYNPLYHIEPNIGGVTKAIAAPLWVQQNIYLKSLALKYDKNIQFHGISNRRIVGIDTFTIDPSSPQNSIQITLIK